ncbi:site-specific tyrosine recombinase XerD [Corynebacterium sp. P5848]|uniref:site-specific tyrosine recombinase XerD n=1 Tax=Corynebacterium marambiense TaxID=2765364 RepID=UPI002260C552|nr:site-specific tyrosine recombinase XerD [Corynebacterium marambiense]MCX7543575.1 site-specific tyrosine recombinase XerD [Corynebacterium marambiense]
MTDPRELAETWLDHLVVERGVSSNTESNYRRDLRRYLGWLDAVGLDDLRYVRETDIERYLAYLRTADPDTGRRALAASSAARALVVARGLHRFGVAEGKLELDVASQVQPPSVDERLPDALTVEQVESLIDAVPCGEHARPADLRDRALLELLYGTGARISEITALLVDDAPRPTEDGSMTMLVLTGKGDIQRIVPVGGPAIRAVEEWLIRGRPAMSRGKTHALLLNRRGGPLSRQSAWRIIREVADRAGLGMDISPHTLRHSYATHLLQGGANIRVVQELLGHASVTTTQIYTHVTPENLRQVWASAHPRA